MAKFPETRHEMERAGYTRKRAADCKACGAAIEWWRTTNGKMIPMNLAKSDNHHEPAVTHWATCTKANQFRDDTRPMPPEIKQEVAMTLVQELRTLTDARAVVLIDGQGCSFSAWRNGLPAEDLRNDLIAAANFVRNEIRKGEN